MTIKKILLQNSGTTTSTFLLGANLVTLKVYFNSILRLWIADFSDENQILNLKGQNLIAGINLLERSPFLTEKFGYFRMNKTAKGVDSLGSTANLYWFSDKEEYEKIFGQEDSELVELSYDFSSLFRVNL